VKASVHHWRFEDGKTSPNAGHPIKELILDPPPRGWYCWVYPKDDSAFEEWMKRVCPTADMCHRFNSGDPMWTVYINDDVEATVFQLMWM
jgi:uncharacterized protein YeaO (DUF488 family)